MNTSRDIRYIYNQIDGILELEVRPKRVAHIRRVIRTILELSERFALDRDRAALVAIAHDMERDKPVWDAFACIADWNIEVTAFERCHPKTLHGPIAAVRLEREYHVTDESLLAAVRHHTLGHPSLDDIGLALYVADFCEPGRTIIPNKEREAILAKPTLEEMVREIIDISRARFGPLEDPTARLYARLKE